MAGSISLALNRGQDGFKISDFVIGTAAPTVSSDAEFRYNNTDANGATITRKDLVQILEGVIRAIESDALFITPLGI